jgi:hypothetical protein
MGTYASAADARARTEIPDDPAVVSDARLEELIADAEDLVDRLVGPRAASSTTGRKWNVDPSSALGAGAVDALKRSTVELVVASYLDPTAFDPPAGESVSGPDFSVTNAAAATPRAQRVLRAAAARLDSFGLRVLSARARA